MSSGFISEKELAEIKKKRQEEWEKVRNPEEPLECPEEVYDSRSLFERLKEQKDKKDLEYEEAHKLKNLIRGLDDDEVDFLDFVDRTKMNAEKLQKLEEKKELEEFRQRVASLQESASDKKLQLENSKKSKLLNHTSTRPSQKSILSGGIVVKKRKNGEIDSVTLQKKQKTNSENDKQSILSSSTEAESSINLKVQQEKPNGFIRNDNKTIEIDGENLKKSSTKDSSEINQNESSCSVKNSDYIKSNYIEIPSESLDEGALKCIGILPGIGKYEDSSDSERSLDSDSEETIPYGKYDLVGRKFEIVRNCKNKNDDDD